MRLLFLFPLIALLLTACGKTGAPTDHFNLTSPKLEATYHWQVLAKDVAGRINDELIRFDMLDTSLSVKPTCGDDNHVCGKNETSPFNEAFHDLLVTELVTLGVPVRPRASDDTLEVRYKVQTVRHDAFLLQRPPPGAITALTAAVMVLRNAPATLIGIVSGGAVDYAVQNVSDRGHYEVLITTSISNGNRYLFRASDIYVINDADYLHYFERQRQDKDAATVRLRGGGAADAAAPALPRPKTSKAANLPADEVIIPIPQRPLAP